MPTKKDYTKTPKSVKAQIKLLKDRNLIIENESKAEKILTFVSYNRLSNYWYPLLAEPKRDEIFKDGSTFNTAFKLYQFDSDFRTITFQAIEQIEIAVRTQIIYHFSMKYNSGFWYENSNAFKNYPQFVNFLSKIVKSTEESKQEFILKYRDNYQQFLPPAWKSFELLTFNALLVVLKNIKNYKDIIPISQTFGLNHAVFLSWLEMFVYIRNICAHHSRLWNIKLTISPVWLKNKNPKHPWVTNWDNNIGNASNDKVLKIYSSICCIIYCLDSINPFHNYRTKIINLLKQYPEIDVNHMGFPMDWKSQSLWEKH